jgi:hypothetical protein
MKTIKEAAEEYAEKHAFRVPYDGTGEFYAPTDLKASRDGFIAGVEYAQRWIKTADERPEPDKLALGRYNDHDGCYYLIVRWSSRYNCFYLYDGRTGLNTPDEWRYLEFDLNK